MQLELGWIENFLHSSKFTRYILNYYCSQMYYARKMPNAIEYVQSNDTSDMSDTSDTSVETPFAVLNTLTRRFLARQ